MIEQRRKNVYEKKWNNENSKNLSQISYTHAISHWTLKKQVVNKTNGTDIQRINSHFRQFFFHVFIARFPLFSAFSWNLQLAAKDWSPDFRNFLYRLDVKCRLGNMNGSIKFIKFHSPFSFSLMRIFSSFVGFLYGNWKDLKLKLEAFSSRRFEVVPDRSTCQTSFMKGWSSKWKEKILKSSDESFQVIWRRKGFKLFMLLSMALALSTRRKETYSIYFTDIEPILRNGLPLSSGFNIYSSFCGNLKSLLEWSIKSWKEERVQGKNIERRCSFFSFVSLILQRLWI